MICEKCGANIPGDRDFCINCGAPVVKPDWVEELESRSEMGSGIALEDNSFKGKNRLYFYGIGSGTIFFGLLILLILFLRLPYIPGLLLASIMILIVSPIIGMFLVTIGMYKTGCVFTCIGAFTAFPVGLAGRKYLMRVWRFGDQTKGMIKKGDKKFIQNGMIINTPLPLKIGAIALVIVIILIPVVSYMFIMNQPMIYVKSYHVPSSYSTDAPVDVKVTLYNYGHQTAKGEKIEVRIEGSDTGKLKWESGDIGMMGSETDSFRVHTSHSLKKIVIYYDGEKIAEKEIEGLWIPTPG